MKSIDANNFIPEMAVIVYSQKVEHETDNYYLESRPIKVVNGKFTMKEGIPLTKKTLSKIVAGIDTNDMSKLYCDTVLPKKLLHFGEEDFEPQLLWYLKSGPHNMVFSKSLNLPNGMMHLPTLVFKLDGSKLSVFATKANHPHGKSRLYKAPFHNVYDNGSICMGSAIIKKSNEVNELMENCEKAFFQSEFTHLHASGSPIKGNLNTFIKRHLGKKLFDKNVLLPSKDYEYLNDLI